MPSTERESNSRGKSSIVVSTISVSFDCVPAVSSEAGGSGMRLTGTRPWGSPACYRCGWPYYSCGSFTPRKESVTTSTTIAAAPTAIATG